VLSPRFRRVQLRFWALLPGTACLDDLEGEILEFGEQGAEFFALSNRGWYSASSAGVSRLVTVLPAILRVHSA
jgi:hypothetical protein